MRFISERHPNPFSDQNNKGALPNLISIQNNEPRIKTIRQRELHFSLPLRNMISFAKKKPRTLPNPSKPTVHTGVCGSLIVIDPLQSYTNQIKGTLVDDKLDNQKYNVAR